LFAPGFDSGFDPDCDFVPDSDSRSGCHSGFGLAGFDSGSDSPGFGSDSPADSGSSPDCLFGWAYLAPLP
jgi:hypothetical protein